VNDHRAGSIEAPARTAKNRLKLVSKRGNRKDPWASLPDAAIIRESTKTARSPRLMILPAANSALFSENLRLSEIHQQSQAEFHDDS
jgi:hypothetical protein